MRIVNQLKLTNTDNDAHIEAEHNAEGAKIVHLSIEHYKDYARLSLTKAQARKLAAFLLKFAES